MGSCWRRHEHWTTLLCSTNVAASSYLPSDGAPALLLDRPLKEGKATAYVYEGFVRKMPINTVLDLQRLL